MPVSLENTNPSPSKSLSLWGAVKLPVLWGAAGMVVSYALVLALVAFLPGPF